jgi:hypothetical protein
MRKKRAHSKGAKRSVQATESTVLDGVLRHYSRCRGSVGNPLDDLTIRAMRRWGIVQCRFMTCGDLRGDSALRNIGVRVSGRGISGGPV